jgi:hypothetical protein
MLPCSWKEQFGIECPTCGFQRSFFQLTQGHIMESLNLFPATIPLILTGFILILHLKFKWKNGARLIVVFFSISALLIVVNYLLRFASGIV